MMKRMTISWMNESPLLAVQCDLQAFIPYNSKLCKLSVNWFCLGIHSKGKMCTNRRLCDQTVKVLVRCGISNRDFVFGCRVSVLLCLARNSFRYKGTYLHAGCYPGFGNGIKIEDLWNLGGWKLVINLQECS